MSENKIPESGDKVIPIRPGVAMRGQGKNEHGLTARQDAFAGYVAEGNTLIASYKRAFNALNATDKTIMTKASDLMSRAVIQRRVNEIVEQNNSVRQLDASRMLSFLRDQLLIEAQNKSSKPADRLKALELIGKLSDVAAFRDRVVTEDDTIKNSLEIEKEIKRKLEKIMAA